MRSGSQPTDFGTPRRDRPHGETLSRRRLDTGGGQGVTEGLVEYERRGVPKKVVLPVLLTDRVSVKGTSFVACALFPQLEEIFEVPPTRGGR